MRALISLCAVALLFAAGCSKTTDNADNPTPAPADQSSTPSTMPPPDQPPPATPSDSATPPPADQATPPDTQPTPPQSQ
jgi:PBP1b-binding outer membrane lipoprotein LpoB